MKRNNIQKATGKEQRCQGILFMVGLLFDCLFCLIPSFWLKLTTWSRPFLWATERQLAPAWLWRPWLGRSQRLLLHTVCTMSAYGDAFITLHLFSECPWAGLVGGDDWQADSRKTFKVSGKFKGSRKLLRQEAGPTRQPEVARSARDARFWVTLDCLHQEKKAQSFIPSRLKNTVFNSILSSCPVLLFPHQGNSNSSCLGAKKRRKRVPGGFSPWFKGHSEKTQAAPDGPFRG